MGFWKSIRHLLGGEADADFFGIGTGLGEDAIVETFAAAEASALGIKGEAGAEKCVDLVFGNVRMGWRAFHDSEAAGGELGSGIDDGVEGERVAVDTGVGPSDLRVGGDEVFQIDLAMQWREDGNGFESGVFAEPFVQGIANGL